MFDYTYKSTLRLMGNLLLNVILGQFVYFRANRAF